MKLLIMCRGIPGCGKSYYAKQCMELQTDHKFAIVNKDDIRLELSVGGWVWSPEGEKTVLSIRDNRIITALTAGKSVISSDTNFGTKHEARLRELALLHGATFCIKDFTDVSLELCIERDSKRSESMRVGAKVITDMYNKWVRPVPPVVELYTPADDSPYTVICDLDGTLSSYEGLRHTFEYGKCSNDKLCKPVYDLLSMFVEKGYVIVYMTGREEWCRAQTEEFLHKHNCPLGPLFMRPSKDNRKDTVVKKELFDNNVRNVYNVKFVIDDRPSVVRMWRELGLFTLAVGPLKEF